MMIFEKAGITPGPWYHVATKGGWDGVSSSKTGEGVGVCELTENNPKNADIIAAAPELLETLIELVDSTENGGRPYRGRDARDAGKRIIKKATGLTWDEIKEATR